MTPEPKPSRSARWAFRPFPEPVVVSWIQFGVYALVALLGIYGYVEPPVSIQESFIPLATIWWASFFVLAGIVGFLSIPRGLWFVECLALYSLWCGIGVYVAVLLEANFTNRETDGYDFLVVAFLVIGGYSLARWFRIREEMIDPRKLHTRPATP